MKFSKFFKLISKIVPCIPCMNDFSDVQEEEFQSHTFYQEVRGLLWNNAIIISLQKMEGLIEQESNSEEEVTIQEEGFIKNAMSDENVGAKEDEREQDIDQD
jgi:hypothetical protein